MNSHEFYIEFFKPVSEFNHEPELEKEFGRFTKKEIGFISSFSFQINKLANFESYHHYARGEFVQAEMNNTSILKSVYQNYKKTRVEKNLYEWFNRVDAKKLSNIGYRLIDRNFFGVKDTSMNRLLALEDETNAINRFAKETETQLTVIIPYVNDQLEIDAVKEKLDDSVKIGIMIENQNVLANLADIEADVFDIGYMDLTSNLCHKKRSDLTKDDFMAGYKTGVEILTSLRKKKGKKFSKIPSYSKKQLDHLYPLIDGITVSCHNLIFIKNLVMEYEIGHSKN